ncbi:Bax inhibitor-1/YccA family protein [Microbacterium sp. bgisy203]|uniref:Bax inhibitor-1/YccA family protein n=1 Tax=Microbacterium sp. bgisy203 TaxID=3413799 RepID=UPI003D73932B
MASNSNPAFSNPAFQEQRPGLTPPAAQTQFGVASGQTVDAAMQAQLEGAYAAPTAGSVDTGRMTVEDTVLKTLALFGILVVTAVVGWIWTMSTVTADYPVPTMAPWIIGALGGFVLAMIVTFTARKKIRPGLIFAYAAFEGLFVGGISAFFDFIWPGIVVQATLATLSVVGVTLALFASGKLRATKRMTKIWMIAMVGYLVFSLVNVIMMWMGAFPAGSAGPFGMYSVKVAGIPLGVIIGIFVVLLAAYSLVMDFDSIQQGARNGAPRVYGWLGAFGLMVTVVWLYVEMLRLIAILRGDN